MAHSVFISYSSQDKKVADAVCATLEHRKIRCWIAPRDALSGIPYAEALIRAINESSIMVLVFSASSNDSPQVMREVERAVDKGLPIIPFRIENVIPSKAMEYYLSAPHWLDAITPPLEKHLRKLADTVQVLLAEVEKPHTEEEGKEETTTKPDTKAVPGGKRKGIYITAGIVVAAAIIVGIILAVGGSGGDDEDVAGLISTTTPGSTSEVDPTASATPTATTSASTSPLSTTSPPTSPPTSTTAPPGTTTTPPGSTTTATGSAQVGIPLQSGTSVQGDLTFTGEVHWYSFYAEEGDAVYLVLFDSTPDGPMNPWLSLIEPTGKVVVEDDGWPNYANVQIYYRITQSGEHTVRVRDKNLGTGPYALSFSKLSETVKPVTPGSFQDELTFPGQAHWYSFNAKAGDSVYIVLVESTPDGPMNPWLSLIDPTGKVVFEDDGWPNYQSVQLDRTLTETGEYLILIRDKNLIGGMYTLSFNMLVMD